MSLLRDILSSRQKIDAFDTYYRWHDAYYMARHTFGAQRELTVSGLDRRVHRGWTRWRAGKDYLAEVAEDKTSRWGAYLRSADGEDAVRERHNGDTHECR